MRGLDHAFAVLRGANAAQGRRVIMVSTPSCSAGGTTRLARRWVVSREAKQAVHRIYT